MLGLPNPCDGCLKVKAVNNVHHPIADSSLIVSKISMQDMQTNNDTYLEPSPNCSAT